MHELITTIFFDFDGVLTTDKSGSYTTCQNIQRVISNVAFEDILACYRKHHQELLIGKIDHTDIWAAFCDCLGFPLEMAVLTQAFRDTPVNEGMMQLCHKLKPKYQLGVITDNSRDRFEVVKAEMNLAAIFDYFIVSGYVGSRKDSETSFMTALALANARAEECIFIDNNASNLIVPAELGFKTIHHDDDRNDLEKLITELRDLGVDLD